MDLHRPRRQPDRAQAAAMPPSIWLAGVLGPGRRDRTVVRWLAEPERLVPMPTGVRWNAVTLAADPGILLLQAALSGPCSHRIGPVLHNARTRQTVWLIPPGPLPEWTGDHPQTSLVEPGELLELPNPEPAEPPSGQSVTWAHWPAVTGTLTSSTWLRSALFATDSPERDALRPAAPPRLAP